MKTTGTALLLLVLLQAMVFPLSLKAQCGGILNAIGYDTILGHSNGNNTYHFSMPQFDPSKGTLVAVDIRLKVYLNASFSLENNKHSGAQYTVQANRSDLIGNPAIPSPFSASVIQKFDFSMGASDGHANQGPDYAALTDIPVLTGYNANDSITTGVATFLGQGNTSFSYQTATTVGVLGATTYSFGLQSITDSVHFFLKYYYCNASILPMEITMFSALKENSETAKLDWQSMHELPGGVYDIEKSPDGENEISVGLVSAEPRADGEASYIFHYPVTGKEKTKLYFRLKETGTDGSVIYTPWRVVDMSEADGSGLHVFPNPAYDYFNVVIPAGYSKKTAIAVYAAHGGQVQSGIYANSGSLRILFREKPTNGIYFIRATDLETGQQQTAVVLIK